VRLREWQQRFQQSVVQPQHRDETLMDALQPGSISRQLQFDIYRNAYVFRLIDALLSNYPALHQLLGDHDFKQLGEAYLDRHPPAHASIRWFGDAMAGFLAGCTPYSGVPVLSELARFEWALRHTIDAADCEPITAAALQAIAPEQWGALRFALHPSITVLPLQWNTPQIWRALTTGQTPPEPEPGATHWIVYRQPDLVSSWRSVAEPELAALRCVAAGGSFADICERVAQHSPALDAGAAASASLLRLWVEQGLIFVRSAGE